MKKVIAFSVLVVSLAACKSNQSTTVAASKFNDPEKYDVSALKGISLDAMHPSPRVVLREESITIPFAADTIKKFKN